MAPIRLLLILVITLISLGFSGQVCNKDVILGEWIYLTSRFGIHFNIDSMKTVIDTTKTKLGIWTFDKNGTCLYENFVMRPRRKQRTYSFDEKACEIILQPTKKSSSNDNNLEILYLDDKYLIYKADNNPKGYFTYLLKRK